MLSRSFFIKDDTIKITKELLGKFLITNIDGQGFTGGMIVEAESYLGPFDKASHGYNNHRSKRNESLYKEGGIAYVYFCYGMYYLFNIVTNKIDIPHGILIRAIEPTIGIDIMLKRKRNRIKQKGILLNSHENYENNAKNKIYNNDLLNKTIQNSFSKNKISNGDLLDLKITTHTNINYINRITSGPGLVSIALGIDLRHNGTVICVDDDFKNKKNAMPVSKDQNNNNTAINKKLEIWVEDRGITVPEEDIVSTARIGVDYAKEHASLPWRFKIKNNKWVSR